MDLESLYNFLNVDPDLTYPALGKLVLNLLESSFANLHTRLIVDILTRATNLRKLYLPTFLLSRDSAIGVALEGLTGLQRLELMGEPYVAMRLFEKSPLTSVHLDAGEFGFPQKQLESLPCLVPFGQTLTEVDLLFGSLMTPCGTSCPLVTTVSCSPCDAVLLQALVPSFPNLEVLCIEHQLWGTSNPNTSTDLSMLRQVNKEFASVHGCWMSLACVVVDLAALYALGLRCRVESLTITSSLTLSQISGECSMLRPMLKPLFLKHLRLCSITDPADLNKLLRGDVAQQLERLDITVDLAQLDSFELEATVYGLSRSLSSTDIKALDYKIIETHSAWGLLSAPDKATHDFMDTIDVSELAKRVIEDVPSLSFLTITVGSTSSRPERRMYGIVESTDSEGKRHLQEYAQDNTHAIRLFERIYLPPQTQKLYRKRQFPPN
ncbi:hypothetical protein EIP86_004029 [Pleurotus ostreatoroseus]|nr:hypothetical protein EIP86_004029 [Pleurotus ostreatoroseus]